MEKPPAMTNTLTFPSAQPVLADHGIDHQPLTLALPSVSEPWRYALAYGRLALASLIGPHRLRLQGLRPDHAYHAPVHISPRLAHRWRALFDVPARAAATVPLLANQSVGTLLYSQLFADLGLNLRHLLHLHHRTLHHASVADCAKSRQQQLRCRVQRVLRLGEDRALVDVQTQVLAPDGTLLSQVEDGFLVRGLPSADLAPLKADRALLRDVLGLRRRLPRLSSSEGQARVSAMEVSHGMGLDYGRISGDMNPVHTCSLGAWLFGLKRPFLQGLALRNLVVRHLAELGASVEHLSLTFASPAYLGQTLLLVADSGALEVHDAKGRLVAFGGYGRSGEEV